MSRGLLLSGLILLGAGCASTRSEVRSEVPAGPAYSLGHESGEPLMIRGSTITGPSSSLTLSDNTLKGRYRDVPVDLKWTAEELTGSVASQGARLELAGGDDTRIQGTFGGARVDLTLDKASLKGRMADCFYELTREEDWYLGRSSCAGALSPSLRLAFPEPLLERPLGERAVLVSLMLLGVNATPTYSPVGEPSRRTRPRSYAPNGRPDIQ
jgi:hypothetical protein